MKININIKHIGSDKNAVDKVLFYFDQIPSTVGELITIITEKCVNDHNECASKTEPEPMTEEYLRDMESVGRFTFGLDYNGKPFGIIKYYRRPNTMEKNIEAAVEAYSGNIPMGLFVDKLPRNLRNLNRTFEEIKGIFDATEIEDFERLPEEQSEKRKFAKAFNQFDTYLQAAKIQGFNWKQSVYSAEDGTDIEMLFDEMTYLILLARYKEMAGGGGGGRGGDVPYDVKIHITEYDTAKIDAEYMNTRFEKFLKLIQGEYDQETLDKTLKDLHKSFSMLSAEEQKYANVFLHDVQAGNARIIPGKSFRDYISDLMKGAERDNDYKFLQLMLPKYLKEQIDDCETSFEFDIYREVLKIEV